MKPSDIQNRARQLAKKLIIFDCDGTVSAITFAARGHMFCEYCSGENIRWGMYRRASACQEALAAEIVKLIEECTEAA